MSPNVTLTYFSPYVNQYENILEVNPGQFVRVGCSALQDETITWLRITNGSEVVGVLKA